VNIVLIGMPGCGKSTVGPLLRRPFYDADAEVERAEGRTVAEIFDTGGEAAFRLAERAVIQRLSEMDGVTIATGGGAVKAPGNMTALKQNGFIVFLDRPPELINTDNADRPLLRQPCQWKKLYRERLPLYRQYANAIIVNESTPEDCAAAILEAVKNKPGRRV
jgi:shikimate kinase